MKKYFIAIFLMFFGFWTLRATAATPPALSVPAGLTLAEIKITGNEFLMLYNNSGALIPDLSNYWLYVFNNVNPLAAGVSSTSQQLPSAALGNGQTILLTSSGGATCGAAVTGKLNISLNDSAGFLEVVQTSFNGLVLNQTSVDALSWSSGTNSTPGMLSKIPSNSSAPAAAYYRYHDSVSGFLWQRADQDTTNPCQLNVTLDGTTSPGPINPGNQYLPGDPPPATFVTVDDQTPPASPSLSRGLAAPMINEILPNPAAPQSDDEDEFIEIYNPNPTTFNLSGFKLQTGTKTLHSYIFPDGTNLAAKSFSSFYSIDTNLSLSNNGGQVRLLDPYGNLISQTDSYSSAKDGQAWALADGKWYWTTSPTPGAANVITTIADSQITAVSTDPKKTAKTGSSAKSSSAKVKATSTASSASSAKPSSGSVSVLHPIVLAAVGLAALSYAAYEYRHDLQNRLYQLRRHRSAGKSPR